ncbi:hypothetical protein M409DRAFT_52285 [Zasmidium cellare ATCC 36951]|uniref:Mid2 domain-containing protein n=1 Tax=Zasmidium cellare ATCC 36951 TaxID=1080233 RepID=A0A6A6CRJ9_ZASCE|nr:uncharacterized protein M409DRAFT_52285 [Zasmidium cellare ATCC 36951]KAF2169784.1 hypothetical protein M409DRAFT_52285 [Zasmidium cellare ATCC 36951]
MIRVAIALSLGLLTTAFADQCFFPDGSDSTDVPCNSSATHSACCASTSYRLSNGVCLSSGILSRGSCTDQSWDADGCGQYCTNYNTGGGYAIMACTNTTFTCRFNPDKCSVTSSVFTMKDMDTIVLKSDQLTSAMELAGVDTGSSSTDSDSTSSTSVPVVTVTATGAASPDSAKGYTSGQMAGVGAGVGVPLLLAIGALSWLLILEKKKSHTDQPHFHPLQSPEETGHTNTWTAWNQPTYGGGGQQRMPSELNNEQVVEIGTEHRLAELEPKYRA